MCVLWHSKTGGDELYLQKAGIHEKKPCSYSQVVSHDSISKALKYAPLLLARLTQFTYPALTL